MFFCLLQQNDRSNSREEVQTPAQRQAAAKLALRKQLEKTLLQIPPPKPPPPEMNFIPNPSNTEFVYLLGLETVVDYLTKDKGVTTPIQQPYRCSQCKIDFTPLWKWEKQGKTVNATFQNTPSKNERFHFVYFAFSAPNLIFISDIKYPLFLSISWQRFKNYL